MYHFELKIGEPIVFLEIAPTIRLTQMRADCINHSCDANTGFARNDLILYALRDIAPEEELSWDYSTSISDPGWSLVCFCESKHCRRVVLPFGDLTSEQQLRLGPISLRYLLNR